MIRTLKSDTQWSRIEHLLPGKASDPGRTAADHRLFVEAVLWVTRTGIPWRDLPSEFGRWERTDIRFSRWRKSGVWQRLANALAEEKDGLQALGRSRGGLSTKLPVAVDAVGNALRIILSAGQEADINCASQLVDGLDVAAVIADKGYDADALVEQIEVHGAQAVIPARSHRLHPRALDQAAYGTRNLIERFFCRLKNFRRLATRYDKLAENFLAFVQLACAFAKKL